MVPRRLQIPLRRERGFVFGALLLVSAWTGCGTFTPSPFNRGDGISGELTFLVPFREHEGWYGESRKGVFVMKSLRQWAIENADADLLEGEDAQRIWNQVRDWTAERISAQNWRELMRGTRVEYVVVGQIRKLRMRDPKNIGLLTPQVVAHYRVINARTGKITFGPQEVVVSSGTLRDTDIPQLELGENHGAAERRLLKKLGRVIGQELYGFYQD